MGKFFKILFWLFNALMVFWIYAGISGNSASMKSMQGAELTGAQIGTGIGVMMLVMIWVVGDIILGLMVLMTRK